jgi:selenocysteine-specific elongation factor
VIATAGHVDHGKSALVRALTGMEPDRWAEERRRGMTIDLGYAWTTLASGHDIAFVDVPGHERFMTNMLAGVGPVPAVMVVVAADGGWSAQTTEHVAAIDALGVGYGLLVVTRSDLADPGPALAEAGARLADTSLGRLGPVEAVAVSSLDGTGLPQLRAALDRLVAKLPAPDATGRVRLWVDRSFTVTGFGTVVTGTLGAGQIAVKDVLELGDEEVTVRRLERMGCQLDTVAAVARVAVNLRGQPRRAPHRGQALLTPGAWHRTSRVDVRLTTTDPGRLPKQLVLHIGSAAVPTEVRALDARHLRLNLRTALPLQTGDRALLRDPGQRQILTGVVIIDAAPPDLEARGAARLRAAELAEASAVPDIENELERRLLAHRTRLTQLGVDPSQVAKGAVEHGGWVVGAPLWAAWQRQLADLVEVAGARTDRLVRAGIASAAVVQALALPDAALLTPLVAACPALQLADGQVVRRGQPRSLADAVLLALQPMLDRLVSAPFDAPTADEVAAAGLVPRQLAAAGAAGVVLRLPGDVILLPDAPQLAARRLAILAQPFTLSAARQALGTSRRVAVPLLEHLDRHGITRRVDDQRRILTRRPAE